jgi:small subunit ribosomal protein S1
VTKITNFGVFVELENDLEGLLHVSELADHKVEDPHDEVQIGEEIEVKILRVDTQERKIGLSKKRAEWATEESGAKGVGGKPKARRGGLHGPGQESTDVIQDFPLRGQPGAPEAESAPDASDDEEATAPEAPADESPADENASPQATTEPDGQQDSDEDSR